MSIEIRSKDPAPVKFNKQNPVPFDNTMAEEGLIDSLPYIDLEYDRTDMKQLVQTEISNELARMHGTLHTMHSKAAQIIPPNATEVHFVEYMGKD